MRRFNDNILRRTEAARKSNKRAQVRLQRIVGDTSGGFEDTKKSTISEMTRQQNLLKRELLGIKLEKIRAIVNKKEDKSTSPNRDVTSTTGDVMPEVTTTSGFPSPGSRRASFDRKDFGKNYFGYRSSPGANTDHQKTRKKMKDVSKKHESFEEVNLKAGNEVLKLRTQHKLKEQQIHNKNVQEKLDRWNVQQEIRNNKNKMTSHDLLRHQQRRHSFTTLECRDERKEGFRKFYKLPPVDARQTRSLRRRPSDGDMCQIQIKITDSDGGAGGDLFDAEIYAPDGRVRKVHRLPDFEKSYEESRVTKYVRTKEKRDYEHHLTVDEIFTCY